MAETDLLTRGLEQLLSGVFDAEVTVTSLRRLGGGSSRENWTFEVTSTSPRIEPRSLVLRRDPPASVADTDRALEVALLSALTSTPIPTPVIVAADLDGAILERPAVVMERARGRADRAVLRDRDPFGLGHDGRVTLAEQLCDLLASLHRLDPVTACLVDVLGQPPQDPAAAEIHRWQRAVESYSVGAQPELAYVAAWLHEHRPSPPGRCTVVHGDFRPANVLVDDGAASTLLDWEFAHLGDPAEDVGWYTTPIYRNEHFGENGPWTPEAFLRRYAGTSGIDVIEPERLRFWEVFALFKLGAIAVAAVDSFLNHGSDRASGPTDRVVQLAVAATLAQT